MVDIEHNVCIDGESGIELHFKFDGTNVSLRVECADHRYERLCIDELRELRDAAAAMVVLIGTKAGE
jgi:hypothetical protein